jgi:hypothetical protein
LRAVQAIFWGVLGGAIGATAEWVLARRLALSGLAIGWLLTLVGWFISARLSERAQRRMFLHNVINAARDAIVKEVRQEQDWVGAIQQIGFTLRGRLHNRQMFPRSPQEEEFYWLNQNVEARKTLYPARGATHLLMKALEEYELLFPETRRVRAQLGYFAMEKVSTPHMLSITDLMNPNTREAAISAMEGRIEVTTEYAALLEDLRVHVQNASLAEITGRRVPARAPQDPNSAIMVMADDGLLDIRQQGRSWPVRTWPAPEGGWHTVDAPPVV